ncbi:MAG: hypothetical protein ACOY4R_16280 [Pseudomonadota bacterium]
MELGEMQVTRSERTKAEPRKFPTFASNRTGGPAQMAMPVNRSERGPETSRPVELGKPKPTTDPAARRASTRRELFYPPGSLRRGRTPP